MGISRIGLPRNRETPGFTLFELLVVLVIAAVFSGFLILRLEGILTGGDLALASRTLIGEIARLRGKAAHTHRPQALRFNIEERVFYPVEDSEGKDREGLSLIEEEKDPALKKRDLPQGVRLEDLVVLSRGKIQAGEGEIRFFPNGCVERSLIHLRNEREDVYTLEINPVTGFVRIYDRYVDQKKDR